MNEEKKYYIYEWIRLDTNEPFYIGKGCGNRWCQLTRGNNNHFNNIVKKIPVVVHILIDNISNQEALEYECWYINYYKYEVGFNLVNIDDGGNQPPTFYGNDSPTKRPEVRKKISDANKEKWKDENHRFKMIEALKKYYKTEIGKKEKSDRSKKVMSNDVVRQKISNTNKIYWNQQEIKDKRSVQMKKIYSNPEIAIKTKGANNGMAKKVRQLDFNRNIINIYGCLTDAEKNTNISFKQISRVCLGKRKSAGGFLWEFVDSENKKLQSNKKYSRKRKSVVQLDINNNYINTYESLTFIENIYPSWTVNNISKCCKKIEHYNTAYGYKWMYYNEYIKQQEQIHNENDNNIDNVNTYNEVS